MAASLAKGLKSRPEPRLARAAAGMILAVKVREHDVMREERRPFKGVGAVGVGAADQFVVAVGLANQFGVAELSNNLAAVALRDDVFQFHTPPLYATGLDNGGPCEKISGGNRIAGGCRAAYAFRQMKTKPKSIYLFLSSEKDFAAFCRILTKTRKRIETIDTIGDAVFSMLS